MDGYRFPGFYPRREVKGKLGDPQARVIVYTRRSKKRHAVRVVEFRRDGTTKRFGITGTSPVGTGEFTLRSPFDVFAARAAVR